MESFKIEELLTVKEKTGLWTIVEVYQKQGMLKIQSLLNQKTTTTVKRSAVELVCNHVVYFKDGTKKNIEDVLGYIMELEENGSLTRIELDSYDKLPTEVKVGLMKPLEESKHKSLKKHKM